MNWGWEGLIGTFYLKIKISFNTGTCRTCSGYSELHDHPPNAVLILLLLPTVRPPSDRPSFFHCSVVQFRASCPLCWSFWLWSGVTVEVQTGLRLHSPTGHALRCPEERPFASPHAPCHWSPMPLVHPFLPWAPFDRR